MNINTGEETVVYLGSNYRIVSNDEQTVLLSNAADVTLLNVPTSFEVQGVEWRVVGASENALSNLSDLAAIIWDADAPFGATVKNPNLLLYVKDESYAPEGVRNVIVGDRAGKITLTDAQSGNNFYCPRAFTAAQIAYDHYYGMKTGVGESRGWETIALPFDVQTVTHQSKGQVVPYAQWTGTDAQRPFWLYELTGSGFQETASIKANTPYIISMPNNELYLTDYRLAGYVSFSAQNARVEASDELQQATWQDRTFKPCFQEMEANAGGMALNVNNDYGSYSGAEAEGSKFVKNLRTIHPFEAYMTTTSGSRSIDVFDNMATAIRGVESMMGREQRVKVYSMQGVLLKTAPTMEDARRGLRPGLYVVNGKKVMINQE